MRFSVYVRRLGTHTKILKVHRSNRGLYLLWRREGSYISYHDDGRCWTRNAGQKTVKTLRDPLLGYTGSGSLTSVYVALDENRPIANADPGALQAAPGDIVLDHPGRFVGVEVILSEQPVAAFPALPERLNSLVYCFDYHPFLIIEAFTLDGNQFPAQRFTRPPRELYHGAGMPPRI